VEVTNYVSLLYIFPRPPLNSSFLGCFSAYYSDAKFCNNPITNTPNLEICPHLGTDKSCLCSLILGNFLQLFRWLFNALLFAHNCILCPHW